MAKQKKGQVELKFILHKDNPYDLEVYEILKEFRSPSACKEHLISSILYYSKAPSYALQSGIDDMMKKVEQMKQALDGMDQKPQKLIFEMPAGMTAPVQQQAVEQPQLTAPSNFGSKPKPPAEVKSDSKPVDSKSSSGKGMGKLANLKSGFKL